MKKLMEKINIKAMGSLASVLMFIGIIAAGTNSWLGSCEPKVPAKLRRG